MQPRAGVAGRRCPGRFCTWLVAGALTAATAPAHDREHHPEPSYQLHAAKLANLPQFVSWPAGSLPQGDVPFTIGVLGEDPFGSELEKQVVGRVVEGQMVEVRRCRDLEEARSCQVVFISASGHGCLPDVLRSLHDASVLTVSDLDEFAHVGGMIGFRRDGCHLRLEINLRSINAAKLKVSSRLLGVARVVDTDSLSHHARP